MAIDFRIRDFFYPFGIYNLWKTLNRTQWLSKENLQSYQEQRLSRIIKQAYQHVPYYRSLFNEMGLRPSDIRHIDDLKKLPLLSKDTLRQHNSSFIAENAASYNPVIYKTSGTTGTPVEIYLDKNANILEFVYYWRHWSWAGYKMGDCFAELGSSFFLNRDHLNESVSMWQPFLRRLMLNSTRISVRHVKKMAEAIRKYRPKFLKGMASSIYYLAYCLKEAGITDISFKAIFSTGEVLTPAYRAMAESVLNCPVLDSYGHMERTVGISQCLEGGYHVNSDYGLLEFDDLRTFMEENTTLGRAIGTSLYNLAMPLIRYDVGDDIELFTKPKSCPCGRSLPLVKAIHGRSEDTIVTPDDRFITSMFIIPEFTKDARFIQFLQESRSSLLVNIVPGVLWNSKEEEKISSYLLKLIGKNMEITIRRITMDEIIRDSSGKIRTVISLLPNISNNGAS
ncbi:phenylacetate--CoA ligase family protein [Thermodesulfobacteriota bacterium]